MKQKQQPAPLGPANYTGPSGDATEGGAAWETVKRYQVIRQAIYATQEPNDEQTTDMAATRAGIVG